MAIKHAFTSGKGDGSDTTLVRASNWNADHTADAFAPSGLTGATTAARFVGGTVSGAPITGTFAVGDYVSSQDGKLYICTSGGSPGVWVAVSGGADLVQVASGAGNVRIPGLSGSPDRLPASPSAYDDEFDSLTGWTTLGTLDTLNVTDFPSHLHLRRAVGAAYDLNGVYKACPSVPFTVTAKLSDTDLKATYGHVGIMVAEASPGAILAYGTIIFGSGAIWALFSSRTSRTSYGDVGDGLYPRYLRMVVTSSTNIAVLDSRNGFIWRSAATGLNPGFTVGSVGFFMVSHGPAMTLETAVDWIRFS